MTAAPGVMPRVDAARLTEQVLTLGEIGADDRCGVTRLAYTPEDVAGRRYVARLMADAGLAVTVDAAGNLIGRGAGTTPGAPAVVIGSHTDTVVNGGRYDGAYGVLAGIEVARRLREVGVRLRRPLEVVAFADEEGAHGTMGMLGSHGYVGGLPAGIATTVDDRGVPVADLVAAVGGDGTRLGDATRADGDIAAYFELHVEQGDVLERLGVPIGVVECITGRVNVALTVHGRAGHAGTTPMENRADALESAARVILAVRAIAAEEKVVLRATTGTCAVRPGMWNVIPGEVRLGVEFRDVRAGNLDAAVRRLERVAHRIATERGTTIDVRRGAGTTPVECAPELRDLIAHATSSLDLAHHHMPSGAGHDAQIVARIAPIGMIFVPSRGGISHAPGEYTEPHLLAHGADVLVTTILLHDATPVP